MALKGTWESEIETLWLKARAEAHSPYGCWQARASLVPKVDSPEPQLVAVWQVVDLDGTVILSTPHEHIAKLGAQLPELADPTLRPDNAPTYVIDDNGEHRRVPPAAGVVHVDAAYESGYAKGFRDGQESTDDDDNSEPKRLDDNRPAIRAYPEPS